MSYKYPPDKYKSNGELRSVGFELEFSGMELTNVASAIQQLYGGNIHLKSRVDYTVTDTRYGDFKVELDARILKKMADQKFLKKLGIEDRNDIEGQFEELINSMAKSIVPVEIAIPPVPIDQLEVFEPLINHLRTHQVEGTESSWKNAFGLHINVEVSDLHIDTILPQFQSFLLLYDWLVIFHSVNFSRQITPFILPFPDAYIAEVLKADFQPDLHEFISHYIEANPTRNRPLDMIPLFEHINKKLVTSKMDTTKTTGRPAYHYRLPNSNVQNTDWSYLDEWNAWTLVEKLAENNEMFTQLQEFYSNEYKSSLLTTKSDWVQKVDEVLNEKIETEDWRHRT